MIIHEIMLDTSDLTPVSTNIKIKQNDANYHTFMISGIDFSECDYAVIKFLRPDNISVTDFITYTENGAKYSLCDACVNVAGTVLSEISLYYGDGRITTCSFSFDVISEINTDYTLLCDDRVPILTELINKAGRYVEKEDGKGLSSISDIEIGWYMDGVGNREYTSGYHVTFKKADSSEDDISMCSYDYATAKFDSLNQRISSCLNQIGDISTALDSIIALQESYIGG